MYVQKSTLNTSSRKCCQTILMALETCPGRQIFSWITSLSGLGNKAVASQPETPCPPGIRPQRLGLFKSFKAALTVLIL